MNHNLERIVLVDITSTKPTLGDLIGMPHFGIGVIGSVLSKADYDVTIYSDAYQDVTSDLIVSSHPGVVMFGVLRSSLNQINELALNVRQQLPKVQIIVGGEEATISPENIMGFADYILQFEGDKRVLKLVEVLKSGGDLSQIKGLQYKNNGEWKSTEKSQRIKEIDFQINPSIYSGLRDFKQNNWIAKQFNLVPIFGRKGINKYLPSQWRYLSFPLQTSRGCPHHCSFCSKDALFGGPGYFTRKIENVLSDVEAVMKHSGISRFSIVDNIFGYYPEYLHDFCVAVEQRYQRRKIKPKFSALMRADQFTNEGVIRLLHNAGFESVSIGVESVNTQTRQHYSNDKSEIKLFETAARLLSDYKIRMVATFAVGGGEDTKEDIASTINFARQNNIKQIHLYPFYVTKGTRGYASDKHLIIPNVPFDYYNGHAVTIFPKRMLPSELQEESLSAMERFYSLFTPLGLFYRSKLRQIRNSLRPHFLFLRKAETNLIEKGVYKNLSSDKWVLDEKKLKEFSHPC